MRKILSIFLVLIMIFSLAGCGSGNSNDVDSSNQNESSSAVNEVSNSISETDDIQTEEKEEPSESILQDESAEVSITDSEKEEGNNILVAYFSRVGNTVWENDVDAVTSASLNVENDEFIGNAEYLAKMAEEITGGDLFLIQTEETYPSAYRDTTDVAKEEQNANARPALASHVENMGQYDTIVLVYPNWWGMLPMPLYTFLEEYDFSGKTILPLCTHEGSAMGSSERAIADLCPNANLLSGLAIRGSNASSAKSDVESWINESGIFN